MSGKSIRERLDNWARWTRWSTFGGGADCITGAICERLRKAALGIGKSEDPDIDEADAELVERAWRAQLPRHKKMLRWVYVRNANPDFVCRRLGIPARPASVFNLELSRAEVAIAKTLDTLQDRNKIPPNNLIPSFNTTSDSTKGIASPDENESLA